MVDYRAKLGERNNKIANNHLGHSGLFVKFNAEM